MKDYNIETMLFADKYNKDENEVVVVKSWEEVYDKYKEVLKDGENS